MEVIASRRPLLIASLARPSTRSKLSGPGFRAFLGIAARWQLNVQEQLTLLGSIPPSTYHLWKSKGPPTLSFDQLERISLVIGIWKDLRLLFAEDEAAKRWIMTANDDAPFSGNSPKSTMLCGSIIDLYAVRRYINAWRSRGA